MLKSRQHLTADRLIPIDLIVVEPALFFWVDQEAFHQMLEIYSDEQLATIADFLTRSAQRSQEFMASQLGKQFEAV